MEMPDDVKELHIKGYRAYMDGNYEEAIKFYEEARSLQPLNLTIIRALDL